MKVSSMHQLAQRCLHSSVLCLLGAALLVPMPPPARGEAPEAHDGVCTTRNVAGAYGFVGQGTILSNTVGLPEGLIATVGLLTFDGQGRWRTSNQTLTLQGQPPAQVSLSGTYTVGADCTFTLVDDVTGGVDAGVFAQHRQEGFFMGVGEGIFLTFTMKRR